MEAFGGSPLEKVTADDELLRLEAALDQALVAYERHWPSVKPVHKSDVVNRSQEFVDEVYRHATRMGPRTISAELKDEVQAFIHRPVFIVGCKKSGTTLLRNLLDSHTDLIVLPSEGRYWTDFLRITEDYSYEERLEAIGKTWVRRLAYSVLQPPFWLLGRSNEHQNPYVEFLRFLFAWGELLPKKSVSAPLTALVLAYYSMQTVGNTPKSVPSYWVDKTPFLEEHVTEILTDFPQARFIHVVRDPRASVASLKRIDAAKGNNRYPIARDIYLLRRSYNAAARNSTLLGQERYRVVKFESVVGDPQNAIHLLSAWLGITAEGNSPIPSVAGRSAVSNSSYRDLRTSGSVYEASVKKYEEALTSQEQHLVNGALRTTAAHVGYELPRPGGRQWLRAITSLLPGMLGEGWHAILGRGKSRIGS